MAHSGVELLAVVVVAVPSGDLDSLLVDVSSTASGAGATKRNVLGAVSDEVSGAAATNRNVLAAVSDEVSGAKLSIEDEERVAEGKDSAPVPEVSVEELVVVVEEVTVEGLVVVDGIEGLVVVEEDSLVAAKELLDIDSLGEDEEPGAAVAGENVSTNDSEDEESCNGAGKVVVLSAASVGAGKADPASVGVGKVVLGGATQFALRVAISLSFSASFIFSLASRSLADTPLMNRCRGLFGRGRSKVLAGVTAMIKISNVRNLNILA